MSRSALLEYLRSRNRAWVLLLVLAASVLYMPFSGSAFVFDDLSFFMTGLVSHYADSPVHLELRWLPYATLSWTAQAFSTVLTHAFHLGNLLLHLVNVVLLFYLLKRLIVVAQAEEEGRSATWLAWLAAMWFALNPAAVYAVGYVVQRSILMATLFALVMQLSYLQGLLTGQRRWLSVTVAAYFLAVFSKEHSVMLPAVLLMMTWMLRKQQRLSKGVLGVTWLALLAIGVLVALRAKGIWGASYEPMAASLFEQHEVHSIGTNLHLLSVLTQAGLFFKYLWLWLLPNPAWMSVDMREPFVASVASWQGWLGLVAYLAYGLTAFWLLLRGGRKALLGFVLLYPWMQFLLEFSTIRVQESFVLYRSYLWMPVFLLVVPLALPIRQNWRGWVVVVVTLLLLAGASVNRLWVFADNYRLWSDAEKLLASEHEAGADRIYFNKGQAARAAAKMDEAIADFKRVVAISPKMPEARVELAWTYILAGQVDSALEQVDAALTLDPAYAKAYYIKALILKRHGRAKEAAALMDKACELKDQMACLIAQGTFSR